MSPPLAEHFVRLACQRVAYPARKLTKLTRADFALLQRYDWPGDIRELQNVIERAVILSQGGALRFDLSPGNGHAIAAAAPSSSNGVASESSPALFSAQELKQRERDNIQAALEQSRWKVYGPGGAAELLGLKPTTLASKIKRLRISRTS